MRNSDYHVNYIDDGYVVISGIGGLDTLKRLELDDKGLIKSIIIHPKKKREYENIMSLYGFYHKDGEIFNYKYIPRKIVLESLFELDKNLHKVIENVNKELELKKLFTIPITKLNENFINKEEYKIPNYPDQEFNHQGKYFEAQVEKFINKQDEACKQGFEEIRKKNDLFKGRRSEYPCKPTLTSPMALPQIFCQFCSRINPFKCFTDIIERDGSIPSEIYY